MPLPEAIELQIVTPQKHVLQETVQAIEMPGKEGYLGILPGHAPLITELGIGILAYRKSGETRYLAIIQGYAEVLPDRVIVLAEIAERAEEINVERAQTDKERAQEELSKTSAGSPDWQEQRRAIERAVVLAEAAAKWGGPHGAHK
jgi:F-type H+-transporting ATPase subunit epsilon